MPKLTVHEKDSAPESSRPLMEAVEKKFGFLPNLMKVLAGSPVSIQSYLQLSQLFEGSAFSAREQQLILLTVSQENRCEYCLAAHGMIARNMAKVPAVEVDQVKSAQSLTDKKADALVTFVRLLVSKRGFVSDDAIELFYSHGYEQRHVLEIIVAIAMKTISNYANHIAHTPIDEAFKS